MRHETEQEKPTNCGSKADKFFWAGRHNANPLNILVYLKSLCAQCGNELGLMTSQRLSIQRVASSALPPFGRNLEGKFW